ncbi:hypothetical protein K466DRAFT_538625 [Polyporus arcularius HHB13444]|uniref:Telomere-associated protein Rif1 N-terminal domain-containing protein n=1 Tax=Polyporus arcularius HHB13444 TaxID=1314778 RepID=A0A5C3PTG7_9APHY|nr:hypothetical protein K466DRAFT_538625 [Polyporus arcularius HHB13444]
MTERRQDNSPMTPAPVTYFRSPLLTLVASIEHNDVPVPDILDAYSILTLRMQSLATSLELNASNLPALGYIAQSSEPLARRLQHDIRRALDDPFTLSPATSPMIAHGSMAPLPTDLQRDAVHAARDASLMTQYALCIVATVFRFPRLGSLFSDTALRRLLDDVLVVARSYDLPCIDSEKVCAMAISAFSVLQLPPAVLEHSREALVGWVKELAECMSPSTDSSKVIHHLFSTYPTVLVPSMGQVLPAILAGIVSTNMRDRVDATVALSGCALAFLSAGTCAKVLSGDIAKQVRHLLMRPLPGAGATADSKTNTLLSHLIDRATMEDTTESQNVGFRWAVTVVCSLICLTGHRVFSGTRACGLVLHTATRVYRRKPKGWPELLACLWRCLVWAFSQLPFDGTGTSVDDPRSGPLMIVSQEVRFGAGHCLIASLLYHPPGHPRSAEASSVDVKRAVSVLNDMVASHDDRAHRDGVWVLTKMVGSIGSGDLPQDTSGAPAWVPDDLIVKTMFARQMATVDAASFASAIRKVTSNPPEVRPLEEAEMQRVWDELRDAWVVCVRRELQSNSFNFLSDELITIWQALLLVRTHLTQERGHLTATEEFTDNAVATIGEFLDWSLQESTTLSPLTAPTAQTRALSLCMQLWAVIRNVFSEAWLSQAANTLLTRVLQRTFDTSSEDVQTAWSCLCAALISASSPSLVARLVTDDEEHRTLDLRRELWNLAAKSWSSMEPQPSGEDSVEFLCIPVGVWSLSEQEMTTWDDILDHAIAQASRPAGSAATAFHSLTQRVLGGAGSNSLTRVSWFIVRLLSRWQAASEFAPTLLASVADFLVELYPDSDYDEKLDTTENLDTALPVIQHIWKIIQECPSTHILSLLSPLADGLAVWIGDEHEYVPVQVYNNIIVSLYCDALIALRHIPIHSDTLYALARFLSSTFGRIVSPGNGPVAFHEFWKEVQPSLKHLDGGYPEELKTALCACHEAFGMSLPSGVSIETESQTDSQAARNTLLSSPGFFGTPPKHVEISVAGVDTLTRSSQPFIRSHALSTGSSSPSRQPHASRLPTASKSHSRLSHGLADPVSPTPARRNNDASRISDYLPSSPTDAMRARRFAAGPSSRVSHERPSRTPDRPLKRRKLSPTVTPNTTPDSSVRRSSPLVTPSPEDRRESQRSSAIPKPTRWEFASVEVQSSIGSRRQASTTSSYTPQPSPSKYKLQEEQLLSPEVPSPATASRAYARAPAVDDDDDYDAWEVPMATDDDVVPDSQPEDEKGDEDSLVPSFMKAPLDATQRANDTGDADDDFDDFEAPTRNAIGGRSERRSPLRMQTAPASFNHDPDSISEEARVPMRRARTKSVLQLEELRDICEALEEGGSQLDVDQMLTATRYTSRMGAIMSEKLSKKLSGGGSPTGSARSHGHSTRSKK